MGYLLRKLFFIFIVFHATTAKLCDLEKYKAIWRSNCTWDEFLPLCSETRTCFHHSLETLTAGYSNEDKQNISCTFPRILAEKEDFVSCSQFKTHYSCPNNLFSSRPRSTFCDGNACNNCESGQELGEVGAGPGFKCQSSYSNKTFPCVLPQVLLYDNIKDCAGGEDLCFLDASYTLSPNCYQCPDKTIIPKTALCDGKFDCPDLSDECICATKPSICNSVVSDFSRKSNECEFGQLKCSDGTCIKKSEVCDGTPQCSDQSDERNRYCGVTLECGVWKQEYHDDKVCRCLTGNPPCKSDLNYKTDKSHCELEGRLHTVDAFYCSNVSEILLQKLSNSNTSEVKQCNGIVECEDNAADEIECDGTFVCPGKNNRLQTILKRQVCDYVVDCADASDESNCDDQRFYCTTSNRTKFVKLNQVRNGRTDCDDGSDECLMTGDEMNSYFFNSQTNLIGNQLLYFFVWIMAMLAVTGNSIVIIRQITVLRRLRLRIHDLSSLKANHVLVFNLAVADFLMGVYLFSVGVSYETLKGSYCKEELVWRGSAVCTWMGVTALVSCEASILTLIMLTTCRLYAVIEPFKTSSNPKTNLILLMVFVIWALSSVVSIVPLTEAFRANFPDTFLLADNPFLNKSVVSLANRRNFLMESLPFYNFPNGTNVADFAESIQSARTGTDLDNIEAHLPSQRLEFQVSARYGYYNVHSICIADLFPRPTDPYWSWSLSITIFNFLAFLYIAAVYIAIYCLSFRRVASKNDRSESLCMQGKIFRIIATNFLTWVPICIMSFMRLRDEHMINGNVYQVAAIILLPINSALNPILYSNVATNLFKKMCGYADDFKRRTIRLTSVDTTLSSGKSTTTLYK